MGCDIHMNTFGKNAEGEWVPLEGNFSEGQDPFNWRTYSMFGFLAGVRNYSAITPISEPRGLPDGFESNEYDEPWFTPDPAKFRIDVGDHSQSWLSVQELLDYDYDQIVEDRRCTRQIGPNIWSGGETCDPGEGEKLTLREFLGEHFFRDLEELKRIRAEMIVFGFDC